MTSPERRAGARRTVFVLLGITIAMAALGAVLYVRSVARAARGSDLVAVAPFDIIRPADERIRERLATVLPHALARGGALRTVSPETVRARGGTGHGVSAARDLGRNTGARFVVFGGLVTVGHDSVRVRASVLDVFTGALAADAIVVGSPLHLDPLADSLADLLRRQMGR